MSQKKWNSQSGQGLTEYAVVLSLVAVLAIAAVGLFGSGLKQRVALLTGTILGESSIITDANTQRNTLKTNVTNEMKKNKGMALSDPKDLLGDAEAGGAQGNP